MALTLDGTLGLTAPAANIAGTLLVNNAAALTTLAPLSGSVVQTVYGADATSYSTTSSAITTSTLTSGGSLSYYLITCSLNAFAAFIN